MLQVKNLFYFIILHLIVATPQINLHYTDWVSESESIENDVLQHDCLRVAAAIEESKFHRQIISYCMSELPLTFDVKKNIMFPKVTFAELAKQNITSQQLYLWSTPIDIIEHYQLYLNQLSTSNESSLGKEVFYNCTLPRFGPMCQYEFYYHYENHLSLYEIIRDFYHYHTYNPTTFTCYKHLQCNRGLFSSCLDWSEICDGKVDCIDGDFDEEHCWQLEINQCKDDEIQCINGQCIPQLFIQDNINVTECLDRPEDNRRYFYRNDPCKTKEPSFGCEDIRCENNPLTNSCVQKRKELLLEAMFSIKDNSTSDDCWSALICKIDSDFMSSSMCRSFCIKDGCIKIIERECPDMLFIPAVPVLFNHIYFAYIKNASQFSDNAGFMYPLVCYNNSHYDDYFVNSSKLLINNTMCYHSTNPFPLWDGAPRWEENYLFPYYRDLWEYNQIWKYNQTLSYISKRCNKSDMYQCPNSLSCISRHYFMDDLYDCPHGDDENIIYMDNITLAEKLIGIEPQYSIELKTELRYIRNHISFQTICDGFIELAPRIIDGRNETDETGCEQWYCNNLYTRCDGLWNCLNGMDEVDCDLSSPFNCDSNHHICVSPHTNKFMCLPITKANDGNEDCIGGIDEPMLCRQKYQLDHEYNFHCMNQSAAHCILAGDLCTVSKQCPYGDDEQFCEKNRTIVGNHGFCQRLDLVYHSDVEKFLCDRIKPFEKQEIIYFSLNGMRNLVEGRAKNVKNRIFSDSSMIKMSHQHQPRCHRGIDLRVWLNNENNSTTSTCLCPPSFYGNICQYQNQRVSLTVYFRVLSDSWQTLFAISISLIDDSDERLIHSYEQFTYLSVRDCKMKYNIYLLYSTRPKNLTKNYSIHIDIYEKISLIYRGSLLFPIKFQFLPVHRLAFIINIPRSDHNIQICLNYQCVHGKCIKYSNNPENTTTFCQCDHGWSGRNCDIQRTCQCSLDSLCIGISANNRSICVCRIHKFGPRCHLTDTICQIGQNSTCQNHGQCIPNDDYMVSNQKFICICPKGFIGDQCEIVDKQLILSFEKDIILSQSIRIHFIEVIKNNIPIRATTFKTIPVRQDSITIYWSRPFHLVFIELFTKMYYLAVVQNTYNRSIPTDEMINSSNRCPHISEVFNESFAQWDLLHRIKYYHLSCQRYLRDLQCFYDDVHLCLCYDFAQERRLANCFNFDHNMIFDCLGQSVCENDGQCFQDNPDCPHKSICICLPCYYGTRCQFSTSGFGLSLDAILGYHILPHISIIHQPIIIKISLALTIVLIVTGLIDGVLSMITFKNKVVCEVGCGMYLLGSSITTLLTMIIFGLKFSILILAQMTFISNRLFLQIQCISLDFLLRVCLNMDQWLNACVAIERAITSMKGIRFDKKKSKQVAKLAIVVLLILNIGTSIHDPFYRRLIEEENDDEKRIWCIVTFPLGLQVFNSVMYPFHFIAPFMINLISAVILIAKQSRQQSNIQTRRTYIELLRQQFQQFKHLFTAPVLLVILALPRLIISFTSKCMKSSNNDAWLFLIGYFISFIPPVLTFVIFILPSKFYKKEFGKSIAHYRTNIQRRLRITF